MYSNLTRSAVCILILCTVFLRTVSAQEYSDSFLATLPIDIQNSDFIELAAWCRRLGLDSSGKRDALERRLYAYYDLAYVPSEKRPAKIVIQKAGLGGYEKISEDAEYISLTGEVYLEMRDEDSGEVHTITADRIIFSENNDSVTAIGNISYILDRGDVQEVFSGERLTFNVNHWGGVFFDGITEREEAIEEKNVRFRFSGKRIIRGSSEKILLEGGTITSSKKDDPYYHIRSARIWVLDEGEWVLEHPVL
ncbi:MAG: hypothetical protein JXB03_08330, partial [Spirochaetales bacterium]|nr:hypothetical protein [Spirochaetales bacterium]